MTKYIVSGSTRGRVVHPFFTRNKVEAMRAIKRLMNSEAPTTIEVNIWED